MFAERPISLTPRLVNSGSSFANAPSSVVQTFTANQQFCVSTVDLGKPYRCVVFRVGKEHKPFVADELVEVDGTVGGLGLEVRGNRTKAEPRSGQLEAITEMLMFRRRGVGAGLRLRAVSFRTHICVEWEYMSEVFEGFGTLSMYCV